MEPTLDKPEVPLTAFVDARRVGSVCSARVPSCRKRHCRLWREYRRRCHRTRL